MNVSASIFRLTASSALAFAVASCVASSHSTGSKPEATKVSNDGPTVNPSLVAEYDRLADSILGARKQEVAIVQKILASIEKDAAAAYARAKDAIAKGDSKGATAAVEDLSTLVAQLGTEGGSSVARVRKRLTEGGHHFNPIIASGEPGGAHHDTGAHHNQDPAHHAAGSAPGAAPGATPGAEGQGHHTKGSPPDDKGGTPGQGHHAAGSAPGAEPTAGAPGHHAAGSEGAEAGKEGHAKDGTHHHAEGGSALGYDPGWVVVSRATNKSLQDIAHNLSQISAAPTADPLTAEWTKVQAIWAEIHRGAE